MPLLILLLDESLLALRALEHLAEGKGDVGGAVALRLVIGGPGLDVGAERTSVHLAAAHLLALHAEGDNFSLLEGSTASCDPTTTTTTVRRHLLQQIFFVVLRVIVLLVVPVAGGHDGYDGDAGLLFLLLLVLVEVIPSQQAALESLEGCYAILNGKGNSLAGTTERRDGDAGQREGRVSLLPHKIKQ